MYGMLARVVYWVLFRAQSSLSRQTAICACGARHKQVGIRQAIQFISMLIYLEPDVQNLGHIADCLVGNQARVQKIYFPKSYSKLFRSNTMSNNTFNAMSYTMSNIMSITIIAVQMSLATVNHRFIQSIRYNRLQKQRLQCMADIFTVHG